ncbi:UNVERIFIED_CONTAM: hypothetical protein Slati_0417900 [Sesamum latifolium]|uniref:Uncharacterized protein n=1 Tax=Sesamum latifolium TaxID=2727402 RepID=A0AAW2XY60_9LAMI
MCKLPMITSGPLRWAFCSRKGESPQDSGRPIREDDLDSLLGEVEAEVRSPPPVAATDSIEGVVPSEGEPAEKKEKAPAIPPAGSSDAPPAPASMPEGTSPSFSGPKDTEGPACGEKI